MTRHARSRFRLASVNDACTAPSCSSSFVSWSMYAGDAVAAASIFLESDLDTQSATGTSISYANSSASAASRQIRYGMLTIAESLPSVSRFGSRSRTRLRSSCVRISRTPKICASAASFRTTFDSRSRSRCALMYSHSCTSTSPSVAVGASTIGWSFSVRKRANRPTCAELSGTSHGCSGSRCGCKCSSIFA